MIQEKNIVYVMDVMWENKSGIVFILMPDQFIA